MPIIYVYLARNWFPGFRRVLDPPEIARRALNREAWTTYTNVWAWCIVEKIYGGHSRSGEKTVPGCWFLAHRWRRERGIPAAGISGCLFRLPRLFAGRHPLYTRGWLFYCRRRAPGGIIIGGRRSQRPSRLSIYNPWTLQNAEWGHLKKVLKGPLMIIEIYFLHECEWIALDISPISKYKFEK